MKKIYLIAGCGMVLDGETEYFPKKLSDFEAETDITKYSARTVLIRFVEGRQCSADLQEIVSNDQLRILNNQEEIEIQFKQFESIERCRMSKKYLQADIYLKPNSVANETESLNVLRNVVFYYLQKMGRLVIHSTSILYEGRAWLFSAPSGTGKSTHVNMWRECGYDFEDLNGDMIACYIENNQIVCGGLPWNGTSGIATNKSAPLGGVFFLKRGNSNRIQEMTLMDKITQFVARSLTPSWDKECMGRNIGMVEMIVDKVNACWLLCRAEQEAAMVTKSYIDKCIKNVIIDQTT